MRGFTHEANRFSQEVEWYTPPEILTALGVIFDLDPCSPGKGKSFVTAREHYTIEDDGLAQPWHGLVFCNPPYGKEIPAWLEKCAKHGDAIALVFARTETRWFQQAARSASAVTFVTSRISFYKNGVTKDCQGKQPGAGSVLIAYGHRAAEIIARSKLGITMIPVTVINQH